MIKFVLAFHGGMLRHDKVELPVPRAGHVEGGPGFYVTSSASEAIGRYSKGGRVTSLLAINVGDYVGPTARLRTLPLDTAIDFIRSHFPPQIAKKECEFLEKYRTGSGMIDPIVVSNLAVNAGLVTRMRVVEPLRELLVEYGRRYDVMSGSYGSKHTEKMVIYDPRIIVANTPLPGNFFDKISRDPGRTDTPMFGDQVAGTAVWPAGMKEALVGLVEARIGSRQKMAAAAAGPSF